MIVLVDYLNTSSWALALRRNSPADGGLARCQ